MDAIALQQWIEALDVISYYELLGTPRDASYDEVRAAFHVFAESFHPDGHLWRGADEQEAVGRIYRRGTEAWRVLSDPTLRVRYDDALAQGVVRPEDVAAMEGSRSLAPPSRSGRLVDNVRSPSARPFALRAEELMKNGDPKQAKIQLVMALHMDKGNAALEAFGKEVDAAIAAKGRAGAVADKKR
jgi:DnaJ-class molecular chaperone